MEVVFCDRNQLTSLDVSELASLKRLYCEQNQITSVDVSGLTSLHLLNCRGNELIDLGLLPENLTEVSCGDNQLTDLGPLPAGLAVLSCEENQLTDLGSLPEALSHLYCYSNQLTDLGQLPNDMICLSCFNNQLTNLGPLPEGLRELYCYQNQLVSLNTLPASLGTLWCHNNQLAALDLRGAVALKRLLCAGNPIRELISLSGDKLSLPPTSRVVMGTPNDTEPWNTRNYGYDISSGIAVLTALPGSGRMFEEWTLSPEVALTNGTQQSSKIAFSFSDEAVAAPVFRYDLLSTPEEYTGNESEIFFAVDGEIDYYQKTMVNEEEAPAAAMADGLLIELPTSYLDTLENGSHAVEVLMTDGYAKTVLPVNVDNTPSETPSSPSSNPPSSSSSLAPNSAPQTSKNSPQTGDRGKVRLCMSLLFISLVALSGSVWLFIKWRREAVENK